MSSTGGGNAVTATSGAMGAGGGAAASIGSVGASRAGSGSGAGSGSETGAGAGSGAGSGSATSRPRRTSLELIVVLPNPSALEQFHTVSGALGAGASGRRQHLAGMVRIRADGRQISHSFVQRTGPIPETRGPGDAPSGGPTRDENATVDGRRVLITDEATTQNYCDCASRNACAIS